MDSNLIFLNINEKKYYIELAKKAADTQISELKKIKSYK